MPDILVASCPHINVFPLPVLQVRELPFLSFSKFRGPSIQGLAPQNQNSTTPPLGLDFGRRSAECSKKRFLAHWPRSATITQVQPPRPFSSWLAWNKKTIAPPTSTPVPAPVPVNDPSKTTDPKFNHTKPQAFLRPVVARFTRPRTPNATSFDPLGRSSPSLPSQIRQSAAHHWDHLTTVSKKDPSGWPLQPSLLHEPRALALASGPRRRRQIPRRRWHRNPSPDRPPPNSHIFPTDQLPPALFLAKVIIRLTTNTNTTTLITPLAIYFGLSCRPTLLLTFSANPALHPIALPCPDYRLTFPLIKTLAGPRRPRSRCENWPWKVNSWLPPQPLPRRRRSPSMLLRMDNNKITTKTMRGNTMTPFCPRPPSLFHMRWDRSTTWTVVLVALVSLVSITQ